MIDKAEFITFLSNAITISIAIIGCIIIFIRFKTDSFLDEIHELGRRIYKLENPDHFKSESERAELIEKNHQIQFFYIRGAGIGVVPRHVPGINKEDALNRLKRVFPDKKMELQHEIPLLTSHQKERLIENWLEFEKDGNKDIKSHPTLSPTQIALIKLAANPWRWER